MTDWLCRACFIQALYEHNEVFVQYLKVTETAEDLSALCQQFQRQGLYFPPGPSAPQEKKKDRKKGGETMPPIQTSFIRIQPSGNVSHRPVTIRELPEAERPANRIHHYGPGSVSTTELIAAILQTTTALDTAQRILAKYNGLDSLARARTDELMDIPGLGPAKAAQLKAAIELGRRALTAYPSDRKKVRCPKDAADLVILEMSTLEQEQIRLILLDTRMQVIDIPTLYVGSLNLAVVRIGEIFREAIRQNSAALVLVHNHPSGDPTPSPEDISLTNQAVQAGKLLDIEVYDHIIIGQGRYVSMKERNLGFS